LNWPGRDALRLRKTYGNFNFEPPDNEGGRPRLGNENDTYMEITWMQAHMLGDNPDVMDVSMRFTPSIRYVQNRGTFITGIGGGQNGRGKMGTISIS